MSNTILKSLDKPAAKAATKAKPASKAKPVGNDPLASIAKALAASSASKSADAATKAARDAERAKRYPIAAQQEAEKAAAKAAKASGVKPATKAETKAVTKAALDTRTAQAKQKLHLLVETARPGNGARLYAHTHAVFSVLGMLKEARPAVPQGKLLQMLGQRAVTYHCKQLNFESAPNHGIRLSATGRGHFMSRVTEGKFDMALANAFIGMFLDGKIDSATGVQEGNVYETQF